MPRPGLWLPLRQGDFGFISDKAMAFLACGLLSWRLVDMFVTQFGCASARLQPVDAESWKPKKFQLNKVTVHSAAARQDEILR